MDVERTKISSGINQLDHILGGGLFIGDNVVWYDEAGILAPVFCLNFIKTSQAQEKSIIYLAFDRSIKNLLELLGSLGEYRSLTILDAPVVELNNGFRILTGAKFKALYGEQNEITKGSINPCLWKNIQ